MVSDSAVLEQAIGIVARDDGSYIAAYRHLQLASRG